MTSVAKILAAVLVAALAHDAMAQQKDRERAALIKLQQQVATLQRDQARLLGEKSELEAKLKALEKDFQAQKTRAADTASRASKVEGELNAALNETRQALAAEQAAKTALEQRLAETVKRGTDLAALQRDTALALAGRESEAKDLAAKLAATNGRLNACAATNVKLHALGGELLDRYEKKSCFDSMLEGEPFTGVKRVELENLVQDYRDKLDAQRFAR